MALCTRCVSEAMIVPSLGKNVELIILHHTQLCIILVRWFGRYHVEERLLKWAVPGDKFVYIGFWVKEAETLVHRYNKTSGELVSIRHFNKVIYDCVYHQQCLYMLCDKVVKIFDF